MGRCANVSNCQTGPPPDGGIRELADGESWCTNSINGNGRVLQQEKEELPCEDPSLYPDTSHPCVDVGQAWGVCSPGQPRLPSRGFEYEPEYLESTLPLSPSALFAEHPGCGSLPVVVKSNRAGRNGGGLFQVGSLWVFVSVYTCFNKCVHTHKRNMENDTYKLKKNSERKSGNKKTASVRHRIRAEGVVLDWRHFGQVFFFLPPFLPVKLCGRSRRSSFCVRVCV